MRIQSFRDLLAWQRAMELVELVYATSRNWPRVETYGLASQVRRAAVSVPSNIAEGHGRATRGEYQHHIGIAYGSLMEVETQILLALRLGYIASADTDRLMTAIANTGRLLNGLSSALSRKKLTPDP
jgi:four helix bundle protein